MYIYHKFNIFEKLNEKSYGAIHNSFIRTYITGNMLGNYKDNNILFCDDLYNYHGISIIRYLDLYRQTVDKAKQNTEHANSPELLATKILIKQPKFEISADGEYKTAVDKLLATTDMGSIVLPANSDAKLRSETAVAELFHYAFKENPETSVNIDSIIDQAFDKEVQNDMLLCLAEQTNIIKHWPKLAKDAKALLATIGYDRTQRDRVGKIDEARELLAKYELKVENQYKLLTKLHSKIDKTHKDGQ